MALRTSIQYTSVVVGNACTQWALLHLFVPSGCHNLPSQLFNHCSISFFLFVFVHSVVSTVVTVMVKTVPCCVVKFYNLCCDFVIPVGAKHKKTSDSTHKRKHLTLITQKLEIIKKLESNVSRHVVMQDFNVGSSTVYDNKKQKERLKMFMIESDTLRNIDGI